MESILKDCGEKWDRISVLNKKFIKPMRYFLYKLNAWYITLYFIIFNLPLP